MKHSPLLMMMIALCLSAAGLAGQASAEKGTVSPLQTLAFLLGDWISKGATELGESEGLSSFAGELDGRIMVRRSSTKFISGRSAGTKHEDLLVIYAEGPAAGLRAIFFDGEGHVIHYLLAVPEPQTAVFDSDPAQPGPRYRLTHTVKNNRLETKFEIALPGQTEYKTYISGTSIKKYN